MADQKTCKICGKNVDPRGLPGHLRFAHGVEKTNGGDTSSPANREPSDAEVLEAVPEVGREGDAITFRNEIRVTDSEAKRQLIEALKDRIRRGNSIEI